VGRWGHSTVLSGGFFYIFGGINSMANLNDIYQFDISTCTVGVLYILLAHLRTNIWFSNNVPRQRGDGGEPSTRCVRRPTANAAARRG
jgi:hypothetical protein